MNLKEMVGLTTKEASEMSHSELYQKIIEVLGFDNVKKCLPYDLDTLKKALKKDKHLNSLPLKTWDRHQAFLHPLYRKNGVTCWSISQGVCILKECARMWAKMEG